MKRYLKNLSYTEYRITFFVLDSDSYIEKIDRQLERSFFQELDYHSSDKFHKKVTLWVKNWKQYKILDNSWCKFIEPSQANRGKLYGLIKTNKVDNPVRVITSECGTTIETDLFLLKDVYIQRF